MIFDDLYIALRDRLTDPARPDLAIRTIDWFNDQPERMEGGETIDGLVLPAVLVRFEEPAWRHNGKRMYHAEGTIYLDVLRDVVDDPLTSDRDAAKVTTTRSTYNQVNEIAKRVIGLTGNHWTSLGLVGMQVDHAYTKMRVETIALRCLLRSDMDPATYETRPVPALVIDANPPMPVGDQRLVLVRNSSGSYVVPVTAPATHDLPDIAHTDSNGATRTLPAMVPMVCTPAAPSTPLQIRQSDGIPGIIIDTVPAGQAVYNLRETVLVYSDGVNESLRTDPLATLKDGDHLTPGVTFPAVPLLNSVGTAYGQVTLIDLINGSAPTAPSVAVSRDGVLFAITPAGVPINVPSNCPTPSPVTVNRDGVLYATALPGDVVNVPSLVPAGDPIIYAFGTEDWSGITASYRANDERDAFVNGFYSYAPSFGSSSQKQYLTAWMTLGVPNVFGNTSRFTALDGSAYASSGERAFIDHLKGLVWYIVGDTLLRGVWNTAIDWAAGLSYAGITDWILPPMKIWQTVALNQISGNVLDYGPFNIGASIFLWSGTTSPASTAQALRLSNALGAASATNKTGANLYGIAVARFNP